MNRIKNWVPAFIVMVFIFLLSATPGKVINDAGLGNEGLHMDGHFLMFFVLCVTYYKATKNVILSIFLTILFGASDELHQLFTSQRNANIKDFVIDSGAGIIAGVIIWKLHSLLPAKLRNWLAI